MRRNREAELSPAVCEWLRSMGCAVYAEISGYIGRVIDHIGIRWADESIVTVEMKTSLSRKVLWQAHLNQLVSAEAWAAVATKPRKSSLDKAARYGLGVWSGGVILQPNPEACHVSQSYRDRVLETCRNRPEGGIGGLPTLKGDGPAIRCAAMVNEYLKAHPHARWQEIFKEVPNHYQHARSMGGAIGPIFRSVHGSHV